MLEELGAVQSDGQGHGLRARVGRRPTEVATGCRIVLARAGGVLAELAGYRGGPDRSRGFLHIDEHESAALDRPRSWRESQRPCAPLRCRLSRARPISEPQERGHERDHRCHPKGTSATRRGARFSRFAIFHNCSHAVAGLVLERYPLRQHKELGSEGVRDIAAVVSRWSPQSPANSRPGAPRRPWRRALREVPRRAPCRARCGRYPQASGPQPATARVRYLPRKPC